MKENGIKYIAIIMYAPVSIQGSFHELTLMGFQFSIWYKSFLTKLAFERLISIHETDSMWKFNTPFVKKYFYTKLPFVEASFLHELIQYRILMLHFWFIQGGLLLDLSKAIRSSKIRLPEFLNYSWNEIEKKNMVLGPPAI